MSIEHAQNVGKYYSLQLHNTRSLVVAERPHNASCH